VQAVQQPRQPTNNPVQGGSRRKVETELILRNNAGAGIYSTTTSPFRVWIPSARLLTIATFGFLPDNGEDAVIPAGWTLEMDAWGRCDPHRYQGRVVRGNQIIPGPFTLANQLPLSYEAVTGVDQWRGLVTVPSGGTGLAVTGDLVVSVSWEPAAGATNISDDELEKIFASCKVTPGNGANVFATVPG
jgi:hypothetical protein